VTGLGYGLVVLVLAGYLGLAMVGAGGVHLVDQAIRRRRRAER